MSKYLKDYQINSEAIENTRTKKKPRKFKDNEDYKSTKKKKKWSNNS